MRSINIGIESDKEGNFDLAGQQKKVVDTLSNFEL